MSRFPQVPGDRVVRALERAGFVVVRQRGSHVVLKHSDDVARRCTVPVHGGKPVKPGTLRSIGQIAMIRRDWFKRQVDILAQAIGAVLGLKAKGEVQASIAAVESAVQKTFGISGKLVLSLSPEDFIALAFRGEKPTSELLSTLAELLREWADLLESQGREAEAEAARARERTFRRLAASKAAADE